MIGATTTIEFDEAELNDLLRLIPVDFPDDAPVATAFDKLTAARNQLARANNAALSRGAFAPVQA